MLPTKPTGPLEVDDLRDREFPDDGYLYFNTASTGRLPLRTITAVQRFAERRGHPACLPDEELSEILGRARRGAAGLVGGVESDVALTTNTSNAINIAAAGLPLQPGDTILVSAGEFPANVYPWLWQQHRGVVTELLPRTPRGWPDEDAMLERLADPRVKALAVSWIQSNTGYAVDLAALGEAARTNDTWLLVDAMQGLGARPFDLSLTPVDFLACGGQKWLLSPWGSGFAYVSPRLREVLRPPVVGWMAFESTDDFTTLADYGTELRGDARRYEVVTLPFQDFVGFNSSLELLSELGVDRVWNHIQQVQAPLVDWARHRGWLATPSEPERRGGIIALSPPDPAAAKSVLDRAGVVTSLRDGVVRVSLHCYNTERQVDLLVGLLDSM